MIDSFDKKDERLLPCPLCGTAHMLYADGASMHEQIKQNALAYAIENYGEYDEHDYTDHSGTNMCHAVSEKAFIAGAHSRDEEIKQWKESYEELAEISNDLETERQTLMIENAKLRNPWKSATKQLPPPEDKEGSDFSIDCLVLASDGSSFFEVIAWYDHKSKCWVEKYDIDQRHTDGFKVYYWMELPKCNHVETEGD